MESWELVDSGFGDSGLVDSALIGSTSPRTHPSANLPVRTFLTLLLLLAALFSHTTAPPSPRPLTLVFVGDVMLGRDVAKALDGDWAAAFADVRPWLIEAHLAFANLESPLTTAPFAGGRFDLRAPPEAVAALTAAGFDFVSLANNHALDGGAIGLTEALDALEQAGVVALVDPGVGAWRFGHLSGSPSPDYQIIEFPNFRLATLAFLDSGQPIDTSAIAQVAAQADLVIVSMHWGVEYAPVTARQRVLARDLVAAGADLIVGHGPHVLQPVEMVDGALVAYSLGNFLFDQPFPDTCRGAILRITLDRGSIIAVEAIPTAIRYGRVHLVSAADDEAATILNQLQVPTD